MNMTNIGYVNPRGAGQPLPAALSADVGGNTGSISAATVASPINRRMDMLRQTIKDTADRLRALEQRLREAGLIVSTPRVAGPVEEPEQEDVGFCAELQSLTATLEAQRLILCRLHEEALF
jgi:hypothetical protein